MGKTNDISALLSSLVAKPLPLADTGDLQEITIFPLPRYPKFSIGDFASDLHDAAPSLRFHAYDLMYDPRNEVTDGTDVQKLCVTFNPLADFAAVVPLVGECLRRQYKRNGMEYDARELSFEYTPEQP